MDEERFDAIVVGGGLSGLSAAYTLAAAGKEVVVIERGDYCGAKNVTGGRIYVSPIRDLFPDLWKKAPFERAVVHEELCVASEDDSLTLRYDVKRGDEPQSYTVERAKFDKYLQKQAQRKGAVIITKTSVEDLVWNGNKIDGVIAGGDELRANVVLLCDGVMSLNAEKAGLRQPGAPKDYAVGVKEIIELDEQRMNDRFNVKSGEGAARLFMGDVCKGKFGGGFLYTNKDSISLGLVISIRDIMETEPKVSVPDLMDMFKARPEVAPLIEGGETVEYSAHVISEGGYKALSKLSGNGVLACGDAAGFALNAGITVRGMEYAMASGYWAAQAVIEASEAGDFSEASLKRYEAMLDASFVMKDFKNYQDTPEAFENTRLFQYYPDFVNGLMGKLYDMPNGPKERVWPTLKSELSVGTMWQIFKKDFGSVKKL